MSETVLFGESDTKVVLKDDDIIRFDFPIQSINPMHTHVYFELPSKKLYEKLKCIYEKTSVGVRFNDDL